MKRGLAVAAAAVLGGFLAAPALARGPVEVVVTLGPPPLARAIAGSRALTAAVKDTRLRLDTATSHAYLRSLDAEQRAVAARIRHAIPAARIRWRYRIVLDGLAVVVPERKLRALSRVRGIAGVYPSVTFRQRLDRSPQVIGAPTLWGPTFSTVGQGMKIGIIDDGVDEKHPFFSPTGLTMPAGFPKGDRRYTTAKVIVARSFPPPKPSPASAKLPNAPSSFHGTHVAGIAAGDRGVNAVNGRRVSGIAPGAYIGNYRVLTIPTPEVGDDGNSPEIVKGIEAAVQDGMDVINLSLGEGEVEPDRDIVARAIDAAADAGVVPALAAGNDFSDFGRGTVISPGSASKAITAAAASKGGVIADFSASGPTPLSLRMKPDVTAPGENILSSVPSRLGTWDEFSGTSMASPHVAGAAALLRQRHPSWTVAQIKSALVLTGDPVVEVASEAATTREGGGMIDLPRADNPLVFADPTGLSFGLLRPGQQASRSIQLTDAGGGAGTWSVAVERQPGDGSANFVVPATVDVPGALQITAQAGSTQGDVTGFLVLTRGPDRRRIPFWLRVATPALETEPHGVLPRTGAYRGDNRGLPAFVDRYRYPDAPRFPGVLEALPGPEQIFRVFLERNAANLGVAVVSEASGVRVEPRIVHAGNENRLTGYTAIPVNMNPYLSGFHLSVDAAGVLFPDAGAYDVVFDSPTARDAGKFSFRFWIGDTRPPTVRLLTRSVRRGHALRLAVRDKGSGVWPAQLHAQVGSAILKAHYSRRSGIVTVATAGLSKGRHTLHFRASDYQESRNDENVARILPNTRELRLRFRLR